MARSISFSGATTYRLLTVEMSDNDEGSCCWAASKESGLGDSKARSEVARRAGPLVLGLIAGPKGRKETNAMTVSLSLGLACALAGAPPDSSDAARGDDY
jgi:hypothetical protein